MSDYCSTLHPTHKEVVAKHTSEYFRSLEQARTSDTYYVAVRYVFIQRHFSELLPLSLVQANHQQLNECYMGQNTTELETLPNAAETPWRDMAAVANIQFLPTNSGEVTMETIMTDEAISHTNPLPDCIRIAGQHANVINVYFAALKSPPGEPVNTTLGIAQLESNVIFCDMRTVGSIATPGYMTEYNLGKVLVHEMGHALGLFHPFTDDECDNSKRYPDIPEQIRPNHDAVVDLVNGEWVQLYDNRSQEAGTSEQVISCINNPGQHDVQLLEQAVNYMDYATDPNSRMFTESQVNVMREYLHSNPNYTREGTSVVTLSSSTVTPPSTDTSTNLSTAAIIGIAIGGLIAFIVIILLVRYFWTRQATPIVPIHRADL